MIAPLAQTIFMPFAASLAVLAALGLYYGARLQRWRGPRGRDRIYRCAVCRHVYVDGRGLPLARCPRCGCLNEAVKT